MKNKSSAFSVLTIAVFTLFSGIVNAQNLSFEERRQQYIDSALTNFNGGDAIVIQAYMGVPVDQNVLDGIFNVMLTKSTIDFDIVKLVRVLFLSNGEYESQILPSIYQVPFWLRDGENLRVHWSENHMILWMSSDWLLHERYNKPIDSNLEIRLRQYLHMKMEYGFYEFFSSTYSPFTLAALLNLADFAEDAEIKDLARQAAQKLLTELLSITNDYGVMYPAAGRNYYGRYSNFYNQNISSIIYLLTGFGEVPNDASHSGGFLATSSVDFTSVINSWTATIDTVYHIGHPIESFDTILQAQSPGDKVIFQWSSGSYFHPVVALESAQMITDSNLWANPEFAELSFFSSLPIQNIPTVAENLSCASKSTVICGEDVAVFKNGSVVLSSIQDFWKGKWGYQQFPCVAAIGTTAVLTTSGKPEIDQNNISADHANDNLPCVTQNSNVALMMYWPEVKPDLVGIARKEVSLYLTENDFDETVENNLWLMGRKGNGYVAVRRACTGVIDGVKACYNSSHQSWVTVVGNAEMYSSFANFQSMIAQSQFEEQFYYNPVTQDSVYFASISVDTVSANYTWTRENNTTSIEDVVDNTTINVYPNPSNGILTISSVNKVSALEMYDVAGRMVYTQNNTQQANISQLSNGLYNLKIITEDTIVCRKIIKY